MCDIFSKAVLILLLRAGMELGQVLSEEQRKERFSSCLRRKRAAQEVIKLILQKQKTVLKQNVTGDICSCSSRK